MKKLSLIVLMLSLAGCGNNGGDIAGSSSAGSATMLPESTVAIDAASSIDSNQFLASAYQDGLAEVQLSQLALQKASNGRVRSFAQRMVEQHTAVNNEFTQLAQRKNIALPTDLTVTQKADLNSLSSLTGDAFDRAYMQWNLTAHENDVAAFKQQAAQGTDADARALADLTAPILKTHLVLAKDISSAINPAAFLAIAYQDGLAEIQQAQLALQKASSNDVRDFAQRMVNDHTQANNQIASLAQQKSVTLPGTLPPSHQAALNELDTFSGADFDKAYMDMNAIDHAITVRLFRKQARNGQDPDIKSLAQSTLPVLEGHLVMAVEVDRNIINPSFLFGAYQDGIAELRLAHLAILRTTNEEVRAFAQRMIDEHTAVNAQMAQLAQQKNVPLPSEMSPEQTLAFAILAGIAEENFDQAYMQYNERLHDHAVAEFTAEVSQGTDADIRTFAQNALPLLQEHLDLAQAVAQRVAVSTQ